MCVYVCVCVCVCVCVFVYVCVCLCTVTSCQVTTNSGKDAAEREEEKEEEDPVYDQVIVGNARTAVHNEAEAEFWADWDARRAPRGDLRRKRMSKGVFLISCALMDTSCLLTI
jgi:hypothetical protein